MKSHIEIFLHKTIYSVYRRIINAHGWFSVLCYFCFVYCCYPKHKDYNFSSMFVQIPSFLTTMRKQCSYSFCARAHSVLKHLKVLKSCTDFYSNLHRFTEKLSFLNRTVFLMKTICFIRRLSFGKTIQLEGFVVA